MKFKITNPIIANIVIFISLVCAAFLIYHPTYLNHNYFWDDERFVFMNPEVLNAESLFAFWDRESVYFRSWPVGYSLFWGLLKFSPWQSLAFYKTLNIIVHALNTFLLYRLFKKLNLIQPLFISLFFLVHPLQIEAVSWVFQLLLLVSFLFFILSLTLLIDYVRSANYKYIVLSFFMFLFSLWTKSSAILAPVFFVYVFWYFNQNYKKYLLLIPFFLISLVIGLDNVDGTRSFDSKNGVYEKASLIEKKIIVKEKHDEKYIKDKENYDSVYARKPDVLISEPKSNSYMFHGKEVFLQGSWHYLSKTIFPWNLQYIYPSGSGSIVLSILAVFILIILPVVLYRKTLEKGWIVVPFVFLSFVILYLGIQEITFFFWSNVSDRYSYYFLAAVPLLVGYVLKKFCNSISCERVLLVVLFFFVCLNFKHGIKFNRPLALYSEIIIYKENPVMYKLLFDEHVRNLDPKNAEAVLFEGLKKFPNDQFLKDGKFQLENFKKNFEDGNTYSP